MQKELSIYDFTFPSINGGVIAFSEFKGKKILLVNTASECAYTFQYKQLQELSTKYQKSLIVVGFPSSDFGDQEPGTDKDIRNFCTYRFGVTFPLATKSHVSGNKMNPIFKFLTNMPFKNDLNKTVTWNFQKFLLDESGKLIEVFMPAEDPVNEKMISYLEQSEHAI